ncbi:GGDEF domain-containing protein [Qipengyuania sp. 1NDH17]|uniref:diguanylate cyclase n=1 Tax=Qipengyuania polymorpha TaxID=2867234 RepID=A0ABS7IXA8_9SPHN|nr:GGDEF domain-containing protein [Qipengyuania polymorpha]MBX7457649.1 GGDEF domain-containing protein [Qipengyuania polymorpha]
MPLSNVVDEEGFLVVHESRSYKSEVFRETLSGILLVERRNLPAQAMLWLVMVLAATRMPNSEFFFLPLMARLFALLHTRFASHRLGMALERGKRIRKQLAYAVFAMLLGGASWGFVLAAVMSDPVLHPARLILGGGTLVGASLITAIVGPAYRLLFAFLAGFVSSTVLGMWLWEASMLLPATFGTLCLSLIFLAFAYALSGQRILTSRTLVENRILSEELADSLAHAEFLAFRDPLTGLMNRRAFFECAGDYDEGQERYLLSLDLDDFKSINDRFGHAVGDKVLVKVGETIKQVQESLPAGDHCAVRLGGEEFVMLLDCSGKGCASAAAERLRCAIEGISDQLRLPGLRTTCSIGLSRWHRDTPIDEVLCNADDALYKAKARGRNRVENTAA